MEIFNIRKLGNNKSMRTFLNWYESNLPNKFNIDLCEAYYEGEVTTLRHEIDFTMDRDQAFKLYEELREFLFGEE